MSLSLSDGFGYPREIALHPGERARHGLTADARPKADDPRHRPPGAVVLPQQGRPAVTLQLQTVDTRGAVLALWSQASHISRVRLHLYLACVCSLVPSAQHCSVDEYFLHHTVKELRVLLLAGGARDGVEEGVLQGGGWGELHRVSGPPPHHHPGLTLLPTPLPGTYSLCEASPLHRMNHEPPTGWICIALNTYGLVVCINCRIYIRLR